MKQRNDWNRMKRRPAASAVDNNIYNDRNGKNTWIVHMYEQLKQLNDINDV